MTKLFSYTFLMLLTGLVLLAPEAMAALDDNVQNVGSGLVTTFAAFTSSNIVLFGGIVLAFYGLFAWLVQQQTGFGLGLIVLGVVITAFPAVFEGAADGAQAFIAGLTGEADLAKDRRGSITGTNADLN